MPTSKLNLKLLRKVRNRVAEIPESYEQSTYHQKDDDAPCGAVACLAGESVIAASPTLKQGINTLRRMDQRFLREDSFTHPARNAAKKLLGLSDREADAMFDGEAEGWPEPYRGRFKRAVRQKTEAKIAVAYLDECLKRKAVMW